MPSSSEAVMEKKRLKMPWQEINLPEDVLPWQERQWTFDIGAGFFRDCGIGQNFETGATKFYAPNTWPLKENLSYDDLMAIQAICAETDCSFAEGLLQHKGEDEFPAKWLTRLKEAKPMYLEGAERKHVAAAPKRSRRERSAEDEARDSILKDLDNLRQA